MNLYKKTFSYMYENSLFLDRHDRVSGKLRDCSYL